MCRYLKGGYYRKNKHPLFFRGCLFFFASHPEAEIDTKTSGRGFSSVALRGFFYLALGCVVQKTDPDFQKTTPQNAGNNRPYCTTDFLKNFQAGGHESARCFHESDGGSALKVRVFW